MGLSDKPGVIGGIAGIGVGIKNEAVSQVKLTAKNTLEQLDIAGNKEGKERLEATPQTHQMTEEALKKQSQETVNWLYPSAPETPPQPPVIEKKPEVKADLKQQLGLEQKPVITANPLEQLGFGKDPNANTISAADQLNIMPKPNLTPQQQQEQAKISGQLHNEYYQKLTTPQTLASDTEARKEEAMSETENKQDRMDRLEQKDLQDEQAKKKKEQPLSVDQAQNAEKNRGTMG